ncbi:MAG: replicative DNA helicase [Alphaproteobacteria bacterium]|nr:replicative DNA helicase [Alphaproteobacteria bacterium]MBQ3039600.1 replicative DNA helicase [Alphaproteobacteria bacterium]
MDFTPKTLPTNLEAEQAVLAAVLMNNRALERVSEFLNAEHFSHPAHQEIYKLAERQFAAGIPFDIITAKNYLDQQGVLESVGGVDYLTQLSGAGATVVNVEQYGRIVYEHAQRRQLINLAQDIMDGAFVEDLDNPVNRQIEVAEQKLFDMATTGSSERDVVSIATALQAALREAETAYKADGQLSGLTTGLTALDKSISGLHHSDLIIVAGRPAMGKTTLAMNIAFNAANAIHYGTANKNYKGAVVFFSLEMSHSQLAARVLSSQSKVPASAMREGNLTDEDMLKMTQYADAISKIPLCIDDTPGMSVPMMRTRARRLARKYGGLALIVVDYLQLMTSPGGKRNDNRVQEISEITRGLKMLAKELDVPVIALSQLSRSVEQRDDKRPQLADLRESGSIEQDADIVMFTYREEYYLANRNPSERISNTTNSAMVESWQKRYEQSRGKADIIIGKNRHGRPETVRTAFFGDYSLFDNLPDEFDTRGENVTSQPTASIPLDGSEFSPTPIDIDAIPDDMPL